MDEFELMLKAMKEAGTIEELGEQIRLGRVLKRFLTENEPGYTSPPFVGFSPGSMTLDGAVQMTQDELELVRKVVQ
jgi:hypothetical protein